MNHKLLQRYFSGSCTPEEKRRVEEWMSEQNDTLPEAAGEVTNNAVLKEELWQKLDKRICNRQPFMALHKRKLFREISIAALTILCVSTAYLFLKKAQTSPSKMSWNVVKSEPGKQLSLTLADGSTVRLNGGSVLEYPSQFDKTFRVIKLLKGEGYFNISHDIDRPFKVSIPGKSDVQVLGTQFNIKLKPTVQQLDITLIKGKIASTAPGKYKLMKPGEQLGYDIQNRKITALKVVDTDVIKAWKDGILWFNDTSIFEVFAELEQYYGVRFVNTCKIEQQAFNGKFKRKSLSEILKLIQYSTDLKFKVKGTLITVYK